MSYRKAVCVGVVLWLACAGVPAQESSEESTATEELTGLVNGDFEAGVGEDGVPVGWRFAKRPEAEQSVVLESTGSGQAAVLVTGAGSEFTNLMQALDATAARGKRLRYRASVRAAELPSASSVQLWFRVDREGGMGAFDNMQDRPIRTEEWQTFDVVLDVAEDATRLNVGIFVLGSGKAWIDDASLEIVDDGVATTSAIDSSVFAAAADAPTQAFFTPWLLLFVAGCYLFVVSQWGALAGRSVEEARGRLGLFALRFSVLYWVLYSFPQPFTALAPGPLAAPFAAYGAARDAVVRWTGAAIFGIEEQLVAPNGSGDTTYAYIGLFVGFVLALGGAGLWTALDRRQRDGRATSDLLMSYLRYVLAATMLGYGLAKVGGAMNQFPIPGEARLARTYGESSPMGLLWTFMGASRPYTIFAGLGEICGGLLLLSRRTTALGAVVVFGVMLNVVLLNFCYDVPVKQYSVHIVLMALYLLLPHARRLFEVTVLQCAAEKVAVGPYFEQRRLLASRRIAKAVLIFFVAVLPIAQHVVREIEHARSTPSRDVGDSLLMSRGFRWINEVPFNR